MAHDSASVSPFEAGGETIADADRLARAQRRRSILEAFSFEREREQALRDQLEEVAAELEGPRIDQEILSTLPAEHATVVRSVLTPEEPDEEPELDYTEEVERAWQSDEELDADARRNELIAELARLNEEITTSRRRQEAYESYLQALATTEMQSRA